ncbi:alpha/beta-hydrolase [Microthyrium microscopicum]|uniref:Alpha/beta-hydrolase n=1 Tax=Microthyrium microscopicum TaxID=703497 RepID=A0A6A6UPJ5_9PEZI|nr:alpha/beta-hydrolase [Microthyrium microscopicum]
MRLHGLFQLQVTLLALGPVLGLEQRQTAQESTQQPNDVQGEQQINGVQWTVGQSVKTTSGTIVGHAATKRKAVSEYLGIPFAKPPVGDLRFAAPQAFTSDGTVVASKYGPDCPANTVQPEQIIPILPKLALPQALSILSAFGQVGNTQSEDCLSLNIWTRPQIGKKKKAVMIWIFGGGFTIGSTNNPEYNGQYFTDDQDVVLVTINYRVNVFGFPGLSGNPAVPQNPGLLDQRLAIQWVEQNIAAFGGDPKQITLFGISESAGASSIDMYQYAYPKNPIARAFIQESGTAQDFFNPAPNNNFNAWFNASSKLGCGGEGTYLQDSVDCVRTKPFQQVLDAIRDPNPLTSLLGAFGPTVDTKTVFSDYTSRSAKGEFAQKPLLIGNNYNEAGLFKVLALAANQTVSALDWAIFNQGIFQCPTGTAANYRYVKNIPTYRYLYMGDFPNMALTYDPPSGAYHTSEIPIVFQTAEDTSGVASTPAEASISRYMNGAWAAFAKDPTKGLRGDYFEFPQYSPLTKSLILFAYDNRTHPYIAPSIEYDILCPALDLIGAVYPGGLPGLILSGFSSGSTTASAQAAHAAASQRVQQQLKGDEWNKLQQYIEQLAGKLPKSVPGMEPLPDLDDPPSGNGNGAPLISPPRQNSGTGPPPPDRRTQQV